MNHRRILFLDIDGVLNSREFRGRQKRGAVVMPTDKARALSSDGRRRYGKIDPLAVDRLNTLLLHGRRGSSADPVGRPLFPQDIRNASRYNVEIVISSTWGPLYGHELLQAVFDAHDVRAPLVGITGKRHDMGNQRRGHEIRDWLDAHAPDVPEENILVLDDEGPHSFPGIAHRLLKTTFDDGLQEDQVQLGLSMWRMGLSAEDTVTRVKEQAHQQVRLRAAAIRLGVKIEEGEEAMLTFVGCDPKDHACWHLHSTGGWKGGVGLASHRAWAGADFYIPALDNVTRAECAVVAIADTLDQTDRLAAAQGWDIGPGAQIYEWRFMRAKEASGVLPLWLLSAPGRMAWYGCEDTGTKKRVVIPELAGAGDDPVASLALAVAHHE